MIDWETLPPLSAEDLHTIPDPDARMVATRFFTELTEFGIPCEVRYEPRVTGRVPNPDTQQLEDADGRPDLMFRFEMPTADGSDETFTWSLVTEVTRRKSPNQQKRRQRALMLFQEEEEALPYVQLYRRALNAFEAGELGAMDIIHTAMEAPSLVTVFLGTEPTFWALDENNLPTRLDLESTPSRPEQQLSRFSSEYLEK